MKFFNKLITISNKIIDKYYFFKFKNNINIELGQNAYIHKNSIIRTGKFILGDYSIINGPITITGGQKVLIGKYCAMGYHITIISTNHKTNFPNIQFYLQQKLRLKSLIEDKGGVKIGNNVWIGDNATILPGVRIGDGVIIGAGSVVTSDIPPFSIAVGVPAKVIKKRYSDEIIEEMLKIKWWDWPFLKIRKNKSFFKTDLLKISVQELRDKIK
ncbi:MAG: CatB-related O-acetyltransferase [Candidatus Odinarchaeota archaeon]